jgi:hypothetical protein
MDPMIFVHVYVSSAVTPFSNEEVQKLLIECRNNNAKLGITGLLLVKDGNFMQILEGPENAVRELVSKIHKDPRHVGVITLLEELVDRSQFPDWTMGFRDLTSPRSELPSGYNEFLNIPINSEVFAKDPTKLQRLMLIFKKNQR